MQTSEQSERAEPEVSIPDADNYTTIVVRHKDEPAARAFIHAAHQNWPFLDDEAPSRMTYISIGDTPSVADAMRMALMSDRIDPTERVEFALDLEADCFTRAECLAYAETEWGLVLHDEEFIAEPESQGLTP